MIANPYAAPQTIHARFHMHELPVAESRGNEDERRDFREFSTEQLTQFQLKSRAIDKAQFAWIGVVVISIIALLIVFGSYRNPTGQVEFANPHFYPWYFGFALIVLRFCAGIDRRRWMRPLIVGMDAALVAACGYFLLDPDFHELFNHQNPHSMFSFSSRNVFAKWYWLALALVVVAAYLVGKSGYAAFHSPELFSKHRYGHARLCQELDYRTEYGIE